jgi:DtxR family Mn-dependent transcriptional regulator
LFLLAGLLLHSFASKTFKVHAMDMPNISSVQEDYLEAIITLELSRGRVRVRDLAESLSVHKSTVTASLKGLAEKGLIEYEPYGRIALTGDGRVAAKKVAARHALLRRFLQEVLLVDPALAEENACRMEHIIDVAVLQRMEAFCEFVGSTPSSKQKWLTEFRSFLDVQNS